MFGWTVVDIPTLAVLPVLLLLSGFFSGSETALFSLTEGDRMTLRRSGTLAGRAVESLLADQRMLLITILVGNMTVNVLYFVITSVLLMKSDTGVIGGLLLAGLSLVIIIVVGEVSPKLIANMRRIGFAGAVAPVLLAFHRLLGPIRVVLDRVVVAPLSRLTSPTRVPPQLDEQELSALLDISSRHGVIDAEEQRILQDVIELSQRRVRDVMTPRVQLAAVPVDAPHDDILALAKKTRLTKFPVYEDSIDHIIGMLSVRRFLLDGQMGGAAIRDMLGPVHYVPETARLDQLLDRFRETRTQLAIVVDEYGGTAGVVAVEDVVEELVGDITGADEQTPQAPMLVGRGRWRVDGSASVHDWAEAFGQQLVSPQVATLGGLIFTRLGKAPRPGDAVELGNVRLEVEEVEGARVHSVIVTLLEPEHPQESES